MQDETSRALRKLHDEYIEAINVAVGENRDDLVAELTASYPEDALRVLTGSEEERAA